MELTTLIEALIFVSPEPVPSSTLLRCLRPEGTGDERAAGAESGTPRLTDKSIAAAVEQLNSAYEEQGRSFRIVAEAGGWRFLSQPDFAPWIERLLPEQRPAKLSPAALETLAIIAYRQPISKAGVEAIRGVGIDGVLQTLLDRGLLRTLGRAALPGKPTLYGTTNLFLEHFGIGGLEELPNAAELRFAATPFAEPARYEPAPESKRRPEQRMLDSRPGSGENGRAQEAKRLSPVAAARKLAESRESQTTAPSEPNPSLSQSPIKS